ncbi:MAG TPA: ATP-binding protein [Scandinavium sp.]|jgi:signal transduction histidine kinase|uniref:ATP-binding protein n=1 Tax=Scandinavium sp. TaxID=2830653 RepID=UPI002E3173BE|nr:ATP-binding protein [Scandinavium sp.]HEX4503117.1 ATP-binding protein [Scandinavium sp.]
MRLWPRSLLARLSIVVLAGLLLANSLSLSLVMLERTNSVRNVMLGNLEYDVATSVAILNRLPAEERAAWLPKLARGNYRYELGTGEAGVPPTDKRSRDAIRSLTDTLANQYPLHFTAVPGPISHIQAHITLHDGAPLTLDLIPHMPPVARWLPVVLIIQLFLVLLCAWLAVRMVIRPFTRFTRAVEELQPAAGEAHILPEQGPHEVRQAARAFNAMQDRIQGHLKERAQILAAISHDLQTPITRMKLRVEMADDAVMGEKLMQDLDTMTQLVREGIAYARSSDRLEEPRQRIALPAFLDSLACDYLDVGHAVTFHNDVPSLAVSTRPHALRRVLSNLLDNALKYGGNADLSLTQPSPDAVQITLCDNGQGIPEAELEAVLQPFYRIENSRNRTTGGTGLGLAIAAQLVAQLGGRLVLANRPEGGLSVSVTLPIT